MTSEAVRVREEPKTPTFTVPAAPIKKALDAAKAQVETSAGSAVAIETLQEALTDINNELKRIGAGVSQAAGATDNEGLREEVDILWWLFGEYSFTADARFKSLNKNAAPLVLARELADRTRLVPGPPAAGAFTAKALSLAGASKKTTIHVLVDETPLEWRRTAPPPPTGAADFTPILDSVRRSIETDGDTAWAAAAAKVVPLDLELEREPSALATQAYAECLLARILGGA